jgi:hypothetical protein
MTTSAGARPSTTRWARPSTRRPSCSVSAYPGGPAVEQAALSGEPRRFRLPVPMRRDPRLDFSFSGLKTAVRQMAEQQTPLSQQTIADLCLAFQTSVTASIDDRISMALERFAQRFGTESRPATRGRRRRRRQQGDPRRA